MIQTADVSSSEFQQKTRMLRISMQQALNGWLKSAAKQVSPEYGSPACGQTTRLEYS